jgi:hypothetical protein
VINEHAKEFAGKPVKDWSEGSEISPQYHFRIAVEFDEKPKWEDKLAAFLDNPVSAQATGLIVGNWGEVAVGDTSATVVAAIAAARDRLPNLTALFLGDVISEESEISWIVQTDVSPLFEAFPRMEQFRVRGGIGLRFGQLHHNNLKSLIVESGGLPMAAVREVLDAQLPSLEHLELWLGEENYGWDGALVDLLPLVDGSRFERLSYLGLRDSEIADEIAAAIANSPILQRIRVLDLSLGTLSDEGAEALLKSPYLERLDKLDVHTCYLSPQMVSRVNSVRNQQTGERLVVDTGDQQKEEEYGRYVAVGE